MKIAVPSLLILLVLAASVAVYGTLEDGVNMMEILLIPFATDATGGGALIFTGPLLGLIIAVSAVKFVGVPLVAGAIVGYLGGLSFRKSGHSLSVRAAWIYAAFGAGCVAAVVLFVVQSDTIAVSRPEQRPKTPPIALASLAGANAALSVLVGSLIVGRMTRRKQ
ncbi:MAG: hypothetical protein ACKVS7_06470 [Gemmatimonadaceae bacterium]